jgi:taurine dioxygenase
MPKLHVGPRTLRAVHADGEQQPYNHLGIQPLSPTIGAELTGVDLGHDLADENLAEVRRALLEF